MLIIFTNPKGGTGKSTLTLLYANYLKAMSRSKLCILDLDRSYSLSRKAKRRGAGQNHPAHYPVLTASFLDIFDAKKRIIDKTFDLILVDLRSMDFTEQYLDILQTADVIICPYRNDELTAEITLAFAKLLQLKNIGAITIYVPNRIKRQEKKQLFEEIKDILSKYGHVAPSILDTQFIEQLEFYSNSDLIKKYTKPALSYIRMLCS